MSVKSEQFRFARYNDLNVQEYRNLYALLIMVFVEIQFSGDVEAAINLVLSGLGSFN